MPVCLERGRSSPVLQARFLALICAGGRQKKTKSAASFVRDLGVRFQEIMEEIAAGDRRGHARRPIRVQLEFRHVGRVTDGWRLVGQRVDKIPRGPKKPFGSATFSVRTFPDLPSAQHNMHLSGGRKPGNDSQCLTWRQSEFLLVNNWPVATMRLPKETSICLATRDHVQLVDLDVPQVGLLQAGSLAPENEKMGKWLVPSSYLLVAP